MAGVSKRTKKKALAILRSRLLEKKEQEEAEKVFRPSEKPDWFRWARGEDSDL